MGKEDEPMQCQHDRCWNNLKVSNMSTTEDNGKTEMFNKEREYCINGGFLENRIKRKPHSHIFSFSISKRFIVRYWLISYRGKEV